MDDDRTATIQGHFDKSEIDLHALERTLLSTIAGTVHSPTQGMVKKGTVKKKKGAAEHPSTAHIRETLMTANCIQSAFAIMPDDGEAVQ